MSNKDGGPAFPNTWFDQDSTGRMVSREHYEGMTLRDYFAARAMQGIVSHNDTWGFHNASGVCEEAYLIADAMLKAREVESCQ